MKALALRSLLAWSLLSASAVAAEEGTSRAKDDAAEEHAAGDKTETAADLAKRKTEKSDAGDKAGAGDDAKPDAAPKHEDKEVGEDDTFGHGFQFGLRAGIALGYKIDFRYDRSPLCQKYDTTKAPDDQIKSCGFGAPPATELALSFAPLDAVEPYLFVRLGLSAESRTNTKPLQIFGVGARIYTMSDSRLKVFLEPAIAYETEGGGDAPEWAPPPGAATGATAGGTPKNLTPQYKKDVVFHVGIGPQYDFAKAFGIFVNGGVDVGVLRAISANLHVNIGAQLRFP